MNTHSVSAHDDTWLLLPWLANGRLAGAQRAQVEEHVRACTACEQGARSASASSGPSEDLRAWSLAAQAPDRTTATPPQEGARAPAQGLASRRTSSPPGARRFAWAATAAHRSARGADGPRTPLVTKAYATYSDRPGTTCVAFDRSPPFGEVEELLRSAGARVVEGPGTTGIFGIVPAGSAPRSAGSAASPQMRALAARLHGDPRVRWIEPLPAAAPAADDAQGSSFRNH
jgi:hypothetical protein